MNEWEYDGNEWTHCDRPAWYDDEGVTCSKCQASFSWDDDIDARHSLPNGDDCHEECCPNCGDVLDVDYESVGFPCDECTESQPMETWLTWWPKTVKVTA